MDRDYRWGGGGGGSGKRKEKVYELNNKMNLVKGNSNVRAKRIVEINAFVHGWRVYRLF